MEAMLVGNSSGVIENIILVSADYEPADGVTLRPVNGQAIGDVYSSDFELINTVYTQNFSELIDSKAQEIYSRWTRFETEYAQRETAARSVLAGQEPSIYVTSFATAAGKTTLEAAQIIVAQADQLRAALAQIAAIRMRKYELHSIVSDGRQALADEIIQQMQTVAESLS